MTRNFCRGIIRWYRSPVQSSSEPFSPFLRWALLITPDVALCEDDFGKIFTSVKNIYLSRIASSEVSGLGTRLWLVKLVLWVPNHPPSLRAYCTPSTFTGTFNEQSLLSQGFHFLRICKVELKRILGEHIVALGYLDV